MRLAIALLCTGLFAALGPVAHADCRGDVTALRPQVDKVSDDHTKQLLEFDLKRARQELGEGDEDECHEAVEHAQKLLRGED